MHKIKYLPLALKDLKDLKDIADYVFETLKAPKAAVDLIDVLDKSILNLQHFLHSCKVYQSIQSLETEYRMLPVKNYLVFYVVSEYDVEIHRIICKDGP